jgi:hypothetical protein
MTPSGEAGDWRACSDTAEEAGLDPYSQLGTDYPLLTSVLQHLSIHRHSHILMRLHIPNCTTGCFSRASFPHRLGFARFCLIASNTRPFNLNCTILRFPAPTRLTLIFLPNSTESPLTPAFSPSLSLPSPTYRRFSLFNRIIRRALPIRFPPITNLILGCGGSCGDSRSFDKLREGSRRSTERNSSARRRGPRKMCSGADRRSRFPPVSLGPTLLAAGTKFVNFADFPHRGLIRALHS